MIKNINFLNYRFFILSMQNVNPKQNINPDQNFFYDFFEIAIKWIQCEICKNNNDIHFQLLIFALEILSYHNNCEYNKKVEVKNETISFKFCDFGYLLHNLIRMPDQMEKTLTQYFYSQLNDHNMPYSIEIKHQIIMHMITDPAINKFFKENSFTENQRIRKNNPQEIEFFDYLNVIYENAQKLKKQLKLLIYILQFCLFKKENIKLDQSFPILLKKYNIDKIKTITTEDNEKISVFIKSYFNDFCFLMNNSTNKTNLIMDELYKEEYFNISETKYQKNDFYQLVMKMVLTFFKQYNLLTNQIHEINPVNNIIQNQNNIQENPNNIQENPNNIQGNPNIQGNIPKNPEDIPGNPENLMKNYKDDSDIKERDQKAAYVEKIMQGLIGELNEEGKKELTEKLNNFDENYENKIHNDSLYE